MARVAFTVRNLEKFSREFGVFVRSSSVIGSAAAAKVFERELKVTLNQPGTGETYRSKRGDGTKHQASRPGKPPAPDTRELLESVERDSSIVRVRSEKAKWMEFGTRASGSHPGVLPRPFMRPTLRKARKKMMTAFVAVFKRRRKRK